MVALSAADDDWLLVGPAEARRIVYRGRVLRGG